VVLQVQVSGATLNNYGFYSEGRASGAGSTNSYQFYADFRGVGANNTNTGVHRGFYADMTPTGELNQVLGDVTGSELAMGVANSSHTITDITGQKIGFNITAGSTVTNAIGLDVDMNNASATATNTYAALFNGGNVGIGTTAPTALLDVAPSTAAKSQFRLRSGTAPTTPNDGDIWFDGTNLNIRISGVTRTVNVT
jgi:hypothetical protein